MSAAPTSADSMGSEMRKRLAEEIIKAMSDDEHVWLCEILALQMADRAEKRRKLMEVVAKYGDTTERTR